MTDVMSLDGFKASSGRFLRSLKKRPLAVTEAGKIAFYCVSKNFYEGLVISAALHSFEETATFRREQIRQSNRFVVDLPVQGKDIAHRVIRLHRDALEEWDRLGETTRRRLLEILIERAQLSGGKSRTFTHFAAPGFMYGVVVGVMAGETVVLVVGRYTVPPSLG